jgi:hypothetical protein
MYTLDHLNTKLLTLAYLQYILFTHELFNTLDYLLSSSYTPQVRIIYSLTY